MWPTSRSIGPKGPLDGQDVRSWTSTGYDLVPLVLAIRCGFWLPTRSRQMRGRAAHNRLGGMMCVVLHTPVGRRGSDQALWEASLLNPSGGRPYVPLWAGACGPHLVLWGLSVRVAGEGEQR
jgi:hypothetical protein